MMDVKKAMRMFGYIIYVILWLPVIILALVILPITALIKGVKNGMTVTEIAKGYWEAFKFSVKHNAKLINSGKWL